MKKVCSILVCLILLCGCNKNDDNISLNINYNNSYYAINTPYKKGVSDNYFVRSNLVSFDIDLIEKGIIELSKEQFDPSNNYIEEGQYLTKEDIKKILDRMNDFDEIKYNKKKIKPYLYHGLYEENFISKNGKLTGISIGIAINKYQVYDNKNNYVTISDEDILKYTKERYKIIINYLREDKNIKNVPILLGLYIENSPNNNTKGKYEYYGVTNNNNNIKFNKLNIDKYYMNNSNVNKEDKMAYDSFVKEINNYDKRIDISALAYYYDKNIDKIDIVITKSNFKYTELLYFTQFVSELSLKYFKDININIEINSVNKKLGYVVKYKKESKTDIFIY